jgi:hypothetical protein
MANRSVAFLELDAQSSRHGIISGFRQLPADHFGLPSIDPRGKHVLPMIEQPTRDADNRFRRFAKAKDHFRKAATPLAIQVNSGGIGLGSHERRSA